MIVDSSALVAIVLIEPGWERLRECLARVGDAYVSAVSLVEAGMVLESRLGPAGAVQLDDLLLDAELTVVPFDEAQARLAREAFRRFGRGRHPAGLNFGDCCVYALARSRGQPLLFVGDDFARTDVVPALAPG
jgi:ribonuclease VapC